MNYNIYLKELKLYRLAFILWILIIVLTAFTGMEIVKGEQSYPRSALFVMSCYSFLTMVLFGAIGLLISIFIKRGRAITSVTFGIVFGMYFIDVVSRAIQYTDFIGYLSPFEFIDSDVLRPGYGFEWWRLLYFIGVSILLTGIAMIAYKRKDILV